MDSIRITITHDRKVYDNPMTVIEEAKELSKATKNIEPVDLSIQANPNDTKSGCAGSSLGKRKCNYASPNLSTDTKRAKLSMVPVESTSSEDNLLSTLIFRCRIQAQQKWYLSILMNKLSIKLTNI